MEAGKESENAEELARILYDLSEIAPHHCDLDFAGDAESGAWNFRSTQLEDGVEWKRRTILTRRRGVGEVAGRTYCRQTGALIPAN